MRLDEKHTCCSAAADGERVIITCGGYRPPVASGIGVEDSFQTKRTPIGDSHTSMSASFCPWSAAALPIVSEMHRQSCIESHTPFLWQGRSCQSPQRWGIRQAKSASEAHGTTMARICTQTLKVMRRRPPPPTSGTRDSGMQRGVHVGRDGDTFAVNCSWRLAGNIAFG